MKALAAFAGLEGLFDLAEGNGVDMCATLLRVLTDLYLQRPIHTPEDEHYYTELALRLIDATEISERAALAARLASYPSAPKPVLERLARDVIEVAGPILEHSPCPAELKAAAQARGGAHADTAATRPGSAPQTARAAGPVNVAEARELSDLFYAAKAPERRLILINLDYAPLISSRPLLAMQRTDVWRLEAAALEHNAETLIGELERMLAVPRAQARRIVNDELGEPMAGSGGKCAAHFVRGVAPSGPSARCTLAQRRTIGVWPAPRGSGDDLIEKMTPGAVLDLEDPRVGVET